MRGPQGTAADPRAAREAARWLVRLQSGEADPVGLARWRAADPQHEAAWRRAELVMQKLGLMGGAGEPGGSGDPRGPRGPLGPLGASALRQAGGAGRRAAMRSLAVLIAAGPAAFLGWKLAPWQLWSADLRTATGERRDVTLPDGSRLLLDTASAVDIVFSGAERRLALRTGALWVQTAADAGHRPFLVDTPQGSARALGTRFSVRTFDAEAANDAATQVAVMQGAVELRPMSGHTTVLQAGQQARMRLTGNGAPMPLQPASDGWTQGVLYAEKMPLGDFAAELARYRPGLLRCDPAVAQLRVSGAFQLADTDAVLAALAASLPVRMAARTRYWVTIGPA